MRYNEHRSLGRMVRQEDLDEGFGLCFIKGGARLVEQQERRSGNEGRRYCDEPSV